MTKLSTAAIRELMLADLARSGLTAEDAKRLHMQTCMYDTLAAYRIPYFDICGKETKFNRLRLLEQDNSGFRALVQAKPQRYVQQAGTINEVYMPPPLKTDVSWSQIFATSNVSLLFTEGEKKAAACSRQCMPTLGLGGVWCFSSKRGEEHDNLLPIFNEINYIGRTIYICFDSDAATNPDIVRAEQTFARRLLRRGARVRICRIPPRKDRKVGIDDYLMEYSGEKFKRNILTTAIEYGESKILHGLNQEVVYVRDPGLIYSYATDQKKAQRMSVDMFRQHAFANVWINGLIVQADGTSKPTKIAGPKAWIEWEHRAELAGITYAPGKPKQTDNGMLNTWDGWGVKEAKRGSVAPWAKLLDFIFEGAEPAARQWFERWTAYPIQNPGYKMATAAVIWGVEQGTGKTLLGHVIMKLYGSNAAEVKDKHLEDGRFEWAENKQFILADDITGHDNRKYSRQFMTMITQKELRLNPKYVPSYTVPDCINYYFTSNDPDAFFMDNGDRRFFIHEVLSDKVPVPLRKEIVTWMNSEEGIQALMYHLLSLPLDDFDPQAEALRTEAKSEMIAIGKSDLGAWVHSLKNEPDVVLNGKWKGDLFSADELRLIYDPTDTKRASANALARELKRSGFKRPLAGRPVRTAGGKQVRLFAIRNSAQWVKAKLTSVADHYEASRLMVAKKEKY